jgi:hypothetical protein
MGVVKINFDKQNDRVLEWTNRSTGALKGRSNALGIRHRANSPSPSSSVAAIKGSAKYASGIIDRVSFKFRRSLIWPHKGAGKGMGGVQGSSWKDKLGITHHTNPESLGKMATGNRVAKQWFNGVMDAPTGVDELATIVAEESGDAIVENILIK